MSTVYLFERDASPELATLAVVSARLQRAFTEKVANPSFIQLVDLVSEKIREEGHTIDTVMKVLAYPGLVGEKVYFDSQETGKPLGEHLPRCVITGYRKYDPMYADFVPRLIQEMRDNGPVVAVFPVCSDYGIDRASKLYLADGKAATNEEDRKSMLALAVALTDCTVIDGIPHWVGSNFYTRDRGEKGLCRIQLDALFMAYAPVIDPRILPKS